MTVPTDFLKTFVAVVDFRSFTKAAQFLGISQPAVSLQLKRLQELLGVEILDKSAPGVRLTAKGEIVLRHARQILALNAQILSASASLPMRQSLRIGIPSEYTRAVIASACVKLREHRPELRFHIRSDVSDDILQSLKDGVMDVGIALSINEPQAHVRHYWWEEVIWARSPATEFDLSDRVPLVTHADNCIYGRIASTALNEAGLKHETAVSSPSVICLTTAVLSGFGVMPIARRMMPPELTAWNDAPLPRLPN